VTPVNRDAEVTASEIAELLPVSLQLLSMWKSKGKLKPVKKRGRSWVYRYGDVVDLERDMARAAAAANNHRARRPVAA
jgi:predicted site-specific integrase-resolvase